MKNLKYFTFERNRYFYGKLLSVDDFETEQRYMNDKRRLVNRFIHGMGVVCGMDVVRVDDESVSVEMGMALDFAGREIIIDSPVITKLSLLDGFSDYAEEDEANRCLYLCVAYDEKEKEAVHSIAARRQAGSREEYNKYAEGYRLYLTAQEPEESALATGLYESSRVLYKGNGLVIRQSAPVYVETEKEFQVRVILEKTGQQKYVNFAYQLNLKGMETVGMEKPEIVFRESDYEKASRYTVIKRFRARAVRELKGYLEVCSGSFRLKIGGREVKTQAGCRNPVIVTSGNIRREILRYYYHNAMEEMVKDNSGQGIYLARLGVVRAGGTYLIDSLEPMPFRQYLFNNTLAGVMNELALMDKRQEDSVSDKGTGTWDSRQEQASRAAFGEVVLDMGLGGAKGQRFFSGEIVHGLGIGNVHIVLGAAAGAGDTAAVIFGEQDIFEREEHQARVRLAAKMDPARGSFTIGMECLEETGERQVRICWSAWRDGRESRTAEEAQELRIQPDMLNMTVRESYYFEALLGEEAVSRVTWWVKGKNSGSIDENGMYTAPGEPGIYEIMARSMDHPLLMASTFVMVRSANGKGQL